jgi:uncharacterized membrane protein
MIASAPMNPAEVPPPAARTPSAKRARALVLSCVLLLIVLGLAWELWLVPLRPGGSLLALKVVPLVIALPWLWRGSVRAYQAWSMGILLYLCEGVVRGMSDPGAGRALGWIEAALACVAFGAILAYVRARRAART